MLVLAADVPGVLSAQSSGETPARQPVDTARRSTAPLFTLRDAVVAAGFVGATVALFPVDERVAKQLQNENTQTNRFLKNASNGFELIAVPGAFIIGGSLYAVGRFGHHERLADLGLHGTEAVLVGTVMTGLLKGAAGRARPFVTSDTNPRDFRFGRGFRQGDDYTSFPSGHTTTAFAAAAAVTTETSRWWPRSTWYVAPAMYGGATMVGLSRMYHNKHWASDVALGAAIGTFSGLKVVQYQHSHPRNRIDRWLLSTTVAADGRGGAALAWAVPFGR